MFYNGLCLKKDVSVEFIRTHFTFQNFRKRPPQNEPFNISIHILMKKVQNPKRVQTSYLLHERNVLQSYLCSMIQFNYYFLPL